MFKNRIIDWSIAEQNNGFGFYHCSQCHAILFQTNQKFDSKTGFPSFYGHVGKQVKQQLLQTYGRDRMQLICQQCGQHLGHLFPDTRTPSQVRYCINENAIELIPPDLSSLES